MTSAPTAKAGAVSPPAPEVVSDSPETRELRRTLCDRVANDLRGQRGAIPDDEATRREIRRRVEEFLTTARPALDQTARERLCANVLNELFGLGPIQPLMEDDAVTEVMVNRFDRVYAERKGRCERTGICFDDDDHVRRVIDRIVIPLGRRLDGDNPLVDARLPDGSRVNASIPPVAIDGCNLTIRKFPSTRLKMDDLVRFGTITQPIAEFLRACVVSRMNIVVAGGTGSGKTTLLNVLSGYIPGHERIVTIEDAAELKLAQEQVVRLESKKPNPDGSGGVTIRDLVRNALRMRPERIVVGECRGGETLDMLQAMNTGHDGSLTTLHANTPRDTVSRIETMALMGGIDFPVRVVREQMASAIQLIVQQQRMRDGSRKVISVTELAGMEGDRIIMQELFRFAEQGIDKEGKVIGALRPSGLRPSFQTKLEIRGFKLPPEMFMAQR
jgi:pilus assembly protein CpaF